MNILSVEVTESGTILLTTSEGGFLHSGYGWTDSNIDKALYDYRVKMRPVTPEMRNLFHSHMIKLIERGTISPEHYQYYWLPLEETIREDDECYDPSCWMDGAKEPGHWWPMTHSNYKHNIGIKHIDAFGFIRRKIGHHDY